MGVKAQFGRRLRFRTAGRAVLAAAALVAAWAASAGDAGAQSLQSVCNVREVDALLERERQTPRTQQIDKEKFYQAIKSSFSIYNEPGDHYTGTDSLIDYWNARPHLKDLRWLAYVMGTSYHETARRMYPVRETLASTDAAVVAILARHSATRNKTYWRRDSETGQHYYGRGYVQLTWKRNYAFADKRLGREELPRDQQFLWTADLTLDPDDAVEILFDGMIYGWYTGKYCLPYYFDPEGRRREDWKNARRIVNILDRWETIADHSQKFLAALKESQVDVGAPPVAEPEPEPAPTPEQMAELRAQIEDLAQANEGLRQQIGRMVERFDAAEAERTALIEAQEARIAELETSIAESEDAARADALAEQNAALQRTNAQLSAEIARLQEREAELDALVVRQATANETLEAEIADLQRRTQETERALNATIETLQADIVERDGRLDTLSAGNHTLNRRIASLQNELGSAQAQIAELQREADKGFFDWLFD